MTAMAARSLGYHVVALDPDPSCAARFVVEECLTASFDDVKRARELASKSSVVTIEIEKISVESLEAAKSIVPVRPGPSVLRVVQDRATQKEWLRDHGFPVGPFRVVRSQAELEEAVKELVARSEGPVYVKSAFGGYDGRGQVRMRGAEEAAAAWEALGHAPCVVEEAVSLHRELSVLVARRPSGETVTYAPALNHHVGGVLEWSVLPGPLEPKLAQVAMELAERLAVALEVEGLLATEFFLTTGGEIWVNEMAPRPHNTFHTTEVACATSQFEQAVRAVCDLPLGSPDVLRPGAIVNLLGDLWAPGTAPAFERALALPGVGVHLYGKRVARPGRKMGHLSAVAATPDEALAKVLEARRRLDS
jgi:5-(carboxyamino)imidazole ribonucleotide synthase